MVHLSMKVTHLGSCWSHQLYSLPWILQSQSSIFWKILEFKKKIFLRTLENQLCMTRKLWFWFYIKGNSNFELGTTICYVNVDNYFLTIIKHIAVPSSKLEFPFDFNTHKSLSHKNTYGKWNILSIALFFLIKCGDDRWITSYKRSSSYPAWRQSGCYRRRPPPLHVSILTQVRKLLFIHAVAVRLR